MRLGAPVAVLGSPEMLTPWLPATAVADVDAPPAAVVTDAALPSRSVVASADALLDVVVVSVVPVVVDGGVVPVTVSLAPALVPLSVTPAEPVSAGVPVVVTPTLVVAPAPVTSADADVEGVVVPVVEVDVTAVPAEEVDALADVDGVPEVVALVPFVDALCIPATSVVDVDAHTVTQSAAAAPAKRAKTLTAAARHAALTFVRVFTGMWPLLIALLSPRDVAAHGMPARGIARTPSDLRARCSRGGRALEGRDRRFDPPRRFRGIGERGEIQRVAEDHLDVTPPAVRAFAVP